MITCNIYSTYDLNINNTISIIAISVTNIIDRIGIMAEISGGAISKKPWKCTEMVSGLNWATKNFDDSKWPNAVTHAFNRDGYGLMFRNPKFSDNNVWFSGSDMFAAHMYCRKKIAK